MRTIIISLFYFLGAFSANASVTLEEIKAEMHNTPVQVHLTTQCSESAQTLMIRYENQRVDSIFIPRRLVDKNVYQLAFLTVHFRDDDGYLETVPPIVENGRSIYDLDYVLVEGGASLEMPLNLNQYFILDNTTEYIAYYSFRFEILTSIGTTEIANNNSYVKFINSCSQ